jgi:hypothetical protein
MEQGLDMGFQELRSVQPGVFFSSLKFSFNRQLVKVLVFSVSLKKFYQLV